MPNAQPEILAEKMHVSGEWCNMFAVIYKQNKMNQNSYSKIKYSFDF